MTLIHIIGNLCSGKTTAAKWLQKQIKGSIYVSIDQYRIKYGDGTKSGEVEAWTRLANDTVEWIFNQKTVIMESSGTSWRMKYFPIGFTILINTPLQVCKTRLMQRGKTDVPWPYGGDPVESLQPIQQKIDEKVAYLQYHYPNRILITDNDHFQSIIENKDFINLINGK